MKKAFKSTALFIIAVITAVICMTVSAGALSDDTPPYFYNLTCDKEGQIVGDGDTVFITCQLADCDIRITSCVATLAKEEVLVGFDEFQVEVDLLYNESTDRFEGSYTFGGEEKGCYGKCVIRRVDCDWFYTDNYSSPFLLGCKEFIYSDVCKSGEHLPDEDSWPGEKPTCDFDGCIGEVLCRICDKVLVEYQVLPALGHKYVEELVAPATFNSDGEYGFRCSVCCKMVNTDTVYRISSVGLSSTSYTCDGKVKTPSVTVKNRLQESLKKNVDYTVTYSGERKNPGKYTVKVTFKGRYKGEKKLSFTIRPATPKVSATQTTDSVTLKWNKLSGVDGYKVYKYNPKTYKYSLYKTTSATSLKISGLKSGTEYMFKVRAYKQANSVLYGKYSSELVTATKPATTKKITATRAAESITLKWDEVNGATHYRVYRKVKGEWKSLGLVTKNKMTVKKLTPVTNYTFAVRAYVKTKTYSVYGALKSFTTSTKSLMPDVTGLTFEQATGKFVVERSPYTYYSEVIDDKYAYETREINGVVLKWNKVSAASGYKVYLYQNKKWKEIASTKSTSYTAKNLTRGKVYKYAVRTYGKINGKTVYGSDYVSVSTAARPKKTDVKLSVKGKKLTFTWDKVYCSGYNLFVSYNGSRFKKIKVSGMNKTSYTVTYPDYAYTVKAVVRSYADTSGTPLMCDINPNEKQADLEPYATKTTGGIKVKPITSKRAKALKEKHYSSSYYTSKAFYEGYSANGKVFVLYDTLNGCWSGIDEKGRWYDEYGKTETCGYCDKVRGNGKGLCDGGCHLIFI